MYASDKHNEYYSEGKSPFTGMSKYRREQIDARNKAKKHNASKSNKNGYKRPR